MEYKLRSFKATPAPATPSLLTHQECILALYPMPLGVTPLQVYYMVMHFARIDDICGVVQCDFVENIPCALTHSNL